MTTANCRARSVTARIEACEEAAGCWVAACCCWGLLPKWHASGLLLSVLHKTVVRGVMSALCNSTAPFSAQNSSMRSPPDCRSLQGLTDEHAESHL